MNKQLSMTSFERPVRPTAESVDQRMKALLQKMNGYDEELRQVEEAIADMTEEAKANDPERFEELVGIRRELKQLIAQAKADAEALENERKA